MDSKRRRPVFKDTFAPKCSPPAADRVIRHCRSTVASVARRARYLRPRRNFAGGHRNGGRDLAIHSRRLCRSSRWLEWRGKKRRRTYPPMLDPPWPLSLPARLNLRPSIQIPCSFHVSTFRCEPTPPHPILYPYFLKRLKGTFPRATLRFGREHNCSSVSRLPTRP